MAAENGARGLIDPDLIDRLKDISDDTKQLIQQEIALAKAEILQKVDIAKGDFQQAASQISYEVQQTKSELAEVGKKAGIGAGLFSGAGLFGLAAFGTLTAALIAGIAEFLPLWASALVVTVLYAIVAGTLAMAGKSKVQQATEQMPAATRHVENVKGVIADTKYRIQQDVPLVPQMTVDSLKESKDEIAEAWKRGSTAQQPPWKSPGMGRR